MTQRAPFIVIEGLDRSGKTTQTSKLHETLKDIGVEAKLIKFPGEPEHYHFHAINTPHVSPSILHDPFFLILIFDLYR